MTSLNIVTLVSFIFVILIGLMIQSGRGMLRERPQGRIQLRVATLGATHGGSGTAGGSAASNEPKSLHRSPAVTVFGKWLAPYLSRLRTVAGPSGLRIVVAAALAGAAIAWLMCAYMTLPTFTKPFLLIGLPLFAFTRAYRYLVNRFIVRFLDGFPEVIDLIVRAVRAGIPVTHVISEAVDECKEPLRSEFRMMGDQLKLGIGLEEVLEAAVPRIGIADFSFFSVCLLLQRETGGQLGETLENLALIIRTRREIRDKVKALTGEARITTKILTAIPFIIMLLLYVLNPPYLMVLFDRPAGHRLLSFAAISVVLGVIIIQKMSKLSASR